MSGGGIKPALFFLSLPDLKSLCCVTLSLNNYNNEEEPRSKQIKTCRELVLLFSEVLASPALDSFTEITAVMSVRFFHRGVLHGFVQRRCLQMSGAEVVFPGVLQYCLSFSVISRLGPNWNKAGLYLVYGLEMSTSKGQLCLSLEANTVRLPPNTLEDFELSPLVLKRFCSDPDCVLDPPLTGGPIWCHVLPSMKKGQIITISRRLPADGPFKSYRELQRHWNSLYGYSLPDLEENNVVYCSVYFKPIGERLFTYPLSCIRLSPMQRCPRVDLQGALSCFMADVRHTLPSVCGFPTRISTKASFTLTSLYPASSQTSTQNCLNLSELCSSRPVLTQLPPPLASVPRPMKPPALPPLWSSPSGPALVSSQPSSRSTSTLSHLFKPASSTDTSFTVHETPTPISPSPLSAPEEFRPKFVPVFKNKQPARHIVALLKSEKQTQRITLPTIANSQDSIRVPTFLPKFPKMAQNSSKVKRILTLSPKNMRKPQKVVTPETKEKKENKMLKSKPVVTFNLEETYKTGTSEKSSGGSEQGVTSALNEVIGKKTEQNKREVKAKAVKEVDVETMARNNQLSRVSSVKLLQWLRERGLTLPNKLPKDQLVLKVLSCLAEA